MRRTANRALREQRVSRATPLVVSAGRDGLDQLCRSLPRAPGGPILGGRSPQGPFSSAGREAFTPIRGPPPKVAVPPSEGTMNRSHSCAGRRASHGRRVDPASASEPEPINVAFLWFFFFGFAIRCAERARLRRGSGASLLRCGASRPGPRGTRRRAARRSAGSSSRGQRAARAPAGSPPPARRARRASRARAAP